MSNSSKKDLTEQKSLNRLFFVIDARYFSTAITTTGDDENNETRYKFSTRWHMGVFGHALLIIFTVLQIFEFQSRKAVETSFLV